MRSGDKPAILDRAARALRGISLACAILPSAACVQPEPITPHVVLISIDTLRADHLSSYGYGRPTSPRIDALAEAGVLFTNAHTQAPWTLPSMASVHTSLYPREHAADALESRIDEKAPMLAEAFRDAGFQTVGVTSHIFVNAQRGFSRGFQSFDETLVPRAEWETTSEELTQLALSHLEGLGPQPFFLWVHYFDPHQNWRRHDEFNFAGEDLPEFGRNLRPSLSVKKLRRALRPREVEYMIDTYDEEIAFTDHHIGLLIDGVQQRAGEWPVVFAVTADHGELMMEHGRFGHGRDLYREIVNVPLVLGGDLPPDLQGRVVRKPVEIRSIPRTLLGLAGVPAEGFGGYDLVAIARGDRPAPEFVFSEGSEAVGAARSIGVVKGPWKLVHCPRRKQTFLYNALQDPGEQRSLWGRPGAERVSRRLMAALRKFEQRKRGTAGSVEIPDEERAQLEALGYVEREE